ncbi:MAG TPA: FkbM family methyltransferase [Cyclobacteriaceae bacterium]|nr:FkbM family methyltransferase [Cyclobacteriaceae bacterium]
MGRSIYNTGVYDVAMTELLWRLIEPGNFVVDVGANVGYTAGISSLRAGQAGNVYAFEPNPLLLPRLKANLAKMPFTNVHLFELGLSDQKQIGNLVLPGHYDGNQGIAYVDNAVSENAIKVPLELLDNLIPEDKPVDVMKIDVEGYELSVFKGGQGLLNNKKIKHIIFEEHHPYPSLVTEYLSRFGYSILRLEKDWFNIDLVDPSSKSGISSFEPPNYLATLDLTDVERKVTGLGYACLFSGFQVA